MDKKSVFWIIGIFLVLVACGCCVLLGLGGATYFWLAPVQTTQIYPTPKAVEARPTATLTFIVPRVETPLPGAKVDPVDPPIPPTSEPDAPLPTQEPGRVTLVPTDTLVTLENTVVSINDLLDLAQRFEGKTDIPRSLDFPLATYQVGDREYFWVTNTDTNLSFQVEAELAYETEHVYFWIENGLSYKASDLRDLVETFERQIYPTNREFFGSEWSPGVDGDPHLYILYATNLGDSIAGYFSSADEYSPLAHEYSNMHEMFMLSADNIGLDEVFTYGVLAHEFQHMIHWYRDRNESSWMNEGFSEMAAFLNNYYESGFDWLYTTDPDIQLTDWPNDSNATTPHYGASFLYLIYFLDRFGEQATQALVANPQNDMSSIDEVLAQIGARDAVRGQPSSADDVFQDWVITSYLQDASVGDGRFDYRNYPDAPQPEETEKINVCPQPSAARTVSQYGVDYIRFTCRGDYTIHFQGSPQVGVLPVDAYSGEYAFWSNKGDESDMMLTQAFDFTDHAGPLILSYWTWYDLEEDYDYLYLVASLDGKSWQILRTPSGTAEDPSGNSYGWGYNGLSGGGSEARWIEEKVDLSQFAGQKVMLRFEYVTDAAVNGEGFWLDDVSIPEIGYFTDFEADRGGWEAAGWARIRNILPQSFRLALIIKGKETTVQYISLAPDRSADIPISIGGNVKEVVLVVSGVTRFTRQPARYQYSIER